MTLKHIQLAEHYDFNIKNQSKQSDIITWCIYLLGMLIYEVKNDQIIIN